MTALETPLSPIRPALPMFPPDGRARERPARRPPKMPARPPRRAPPAPDRLDEYASPLQ